MFQPSIDIMLKTTATKQKKLRLITIFSSLFSRCVAEISLAPFPSADLLLSLCSSPFALKLYDHRVCAVTRQSLLCLRFVLAGCSLRQNGDALITHATLLFSAAFQIQQVLKRARRASERPNRQHERKVRRELQKGFSLKLEDSVGARTCSCSQSQLHPPFASKSPAGSTH